MRKCRIDPMIEAADREAFIKRFAHLFEHSPWVVEHAWEKRPFAKAETLTHALMTTVHEAAPDKQLALIRAHPQLGIRQALTDASEAEQAGAGLKALSADEFARFAALNAAYQEKFGFPFIICVGGKTKSEILAAFEARLLNDAPTEQNAALEEIGGIARLRLARVLGEAELAP
jgi:2-oxo-4-hydroxy-4-carboxy-5-ureidoimidazoline decarboxylase